MCRSYLLIVVSLWFFSPVLAQEQTSTCAFDVAKALETVGTACDETSRNEACYGHEDVEVSFVDDAAELAFSNPADRVEVFALKRIAPSPVDTDTEAWGIAVLKAQVNLPNTLPGQAVTFVLMGETIVENDVAYEAALDKLPIVGYVNTNANIRSLPSTSAPIVGSVASSEDVRLIGINETGDWLKLAREDGNIAWIFAALVDVDDVRTLPVAAESEPAFPYAPLQAITLSTGIGGIQCDDAPDALVLQNPSGEPVVMRINDLVVTLGSTVVLFVETHDGIPVLTMTLVEGQVMAQHGTLAFTLSQPGHSAAITLNAEGLVGSESTLIGLEQENFATIIETACRNASTIGLLEGVALDSCPQEVSFVYGEELPTIAIEDDSTLNGPCEITASVNINLRSGPGTLYGRNGLLESGVQMNPVGYVSYAEGLDSTKWWKLDDEKWIRADLAAASGDCDKVEQLEPPPLPEGLNLSTHIQIEWGYTDPNLHPANTPLHITAGHCAADEQLAYNSWDYFTDDLIINGVSYGETHTRSGNPDGNVYDQGYPHPYGVSVSWTIPGLPAGTYTIEETWTYSQNWSCNWDAGSFHPAGQTLVRTTVFTVIDVPGSG